MTDLVDTMQAVRDLETIPVTRGQLVQLLIRLHLAEGMNCAQAELHARMHVNAAFAQLRSEKK